MNEGRQEFRVAYVGPGLSGRATSLAHVLRARGQAVTPEMLRESHDHVLVGGSSRVHVWVSWARAWLWYSTPHSTELDPRVLTELELLRETHGFVFVIDCRDFRMQASVEAYERLSADLKSRNRLLDELPIVFQANRRDEPNACSMEWIRESFKCPRSSYVESNAMTGKGTVESFEALLRLLELGTRT